MREQIRLVELTDLEPGDIVRFGDGPYMDATVKHVAKDGTVSFFRPYVQSSDFTTTSGVICTIGIETFSTSRTDQQWQRWDRIRRAVPSERAKDPNEARIDKAGA